MNLNSVFFRFHAPRTPFKPNPNGQKIINSFISLGILATWELENLPS